MLTWLFNKISPPREQPVPPTNEGVSVATDFIKPQSAAELLASPRRQKLLTHIWQRTAVSRQQFALLYLKPVERYAALVQQFPASEAHHHAYLGGMLDHGLEIVAYALKLRQSYLLPIGSTPEDQAAQAEAWTAGIAYAALLHDIGKIAVDLHVENENGHIWHPWQGTLTQPYRFKYRSDRAYRLHNAATGLLYNQILDAQLMDWLSQYPPLWSSLLYVLAGQLEYAGVLGEIVTKADQSSVVQELGGDPAKAMAAPKHSLQRKLLDGLRYLVKEQLKLNNAGPSDGWLTEEALWLVSKTVSDKLRAYLLSQGVSGIPAKNSAIFDVLQEHSILLPTAEDKAIWSAVVDSGTGWQNSFTFLKVSPAMIWNSGERPEAFTGTVTANIHTDSSEVTGTQENDTQATQPIPPIATTTDVNAADSLEAVFDIFGLEDITTQTADNTLTAAEPAMQIVIDRIEPVNKVTPQGITEKAEAVKELVMPEPVTKSKALVNKDNVTNNCTPSGEHFIEWLKEAILTKKLIINDTKALIHTVADTVYIVTPGVFMRYAQEFPAVQPLAKAENLTDWRWVQKGFERLKLHKKQPTGLNIWTCSVTGPHKSRQLHGYLLLNPNVLFEQEFVNNPYLKVLDSKDAH